MGTYTYTYTCTCTCTFMKTCDLYMLTCMKCTMSLMSMGDFKFDVECFSLFDACID